MNILEKSESFLMKIKYLVHDPEMVLLDNIIWKKIYVQIGMFYL